MALPESAADRPDELVRLLAAEEHPAADALLAGLDIRDLTYVGAGLTRIARTEGRRLPPAQRAQAGGRQARLGLMRDASRGNPDGLRAWVRRAAEEILLVRSLQATADRINDKG